MQKWVRDDRVVRSRACRQPALVAEVIKPAEADAEVTGHLSGSAPRLLGMLGSPRMSDVAGDPVTWIGRDIDEVLAELGGGERSVERDVKRIYGTAPALGIELISNLGGVIRSVMLFSGDDGEHQHYTGILPGTMGFDLGRDEVRDLFGAPDSGKDEPSKDVLGVAPPWDRWNTFSGDLMLHILYTLDAQAVQRVGVMHPDVFL